MCWLWVDDAARARRWGWRRQVTEPLLLISRALSHSLTLSHSFLLNKGDAPKASPIVVTEVSVYVPCGCDVTVK